MQFRKKNTKQQIYASDPSSDGQSVSVGRVYLTEYSLGIVVVCFILFVYIIIDILRGYFIQN